jgi:methylase of polypeptide subunit release factors
LSAANGVDVVELVRKECAVVEEEQGRRSAVLDVGTGTGVWAVEVASGGRWCDVLGIE